MNSREHLTTMSSKVGTSSDITIGENSSSKTLTANTNLPGETLLANTKIVAAPNTNPKIKLSSALMTLTSSD